MPLIKFKKWKKNNNLYELQLLKCFDGFAVVCVKNGSTVLSQYFFFRNEANKLFNLIKYTEVED